MSKESFRQVFAPSAKTVKESRNKHRKAAWTWFLLSLALSTGVTVGLYLLLEKFGEAISAPLASRITLALIGGEAIVAVVASIATYYHNSKADRFNWELKNEYIAFDTWERTRFYNY